jgi:signal transduction histidine kinase
MKETPQADGKIQRTSAAYEQTPIGARARELDRLKSHFLAAMRHELRASVNSIIASTDLLARAGLSAEHSERIGSIRKNCNAIVRIIEDMNRFAQIDPANMFEELANFWFATRFGGPGRIMRRSAKPRRPGRHPASRSKAGAATAS